MIKTLEQQLGYPLLERTQGGAFGGGSILTERGKVFLDKYIAYEKQVKSAAEDLFETYFGGMFA